MIFSSILKVSPKPFLHESASPAAAGLPPQLIVILTQELQSVDEAHNLLWKSLALTFDGSFLPNGHFFQSSSGDCHSLTNVWARKNYCLEEQKYRLEEKKLMFGGKKIMLGVLNDVPQVDLATDFAKAL